MSTRALVTVLMLLGVCRVAAAQVQVQEFFAGDQNPHASFGAAAAAEGAIVVVGARNDMPPGAPGPFGAAYVFELLGGSMRQIQKLVPPLGVVGSTFGNAVALSDDWIAVGAEAEGSYKGAVYMFQRQGGTVRPAAAARGLRWCFGRQLRVRARPLGRSPDRRRALEIHPRAR